MSITNKIKDYQFKPKPAAGLPPFLTEKLVVLKLLPVAVYWRYKGQLRLFG